MVGETVARGIQTTRSVCVELVASVAGAARRAVAVALEPRTVDEAAVKAPHQPHAPHSTSCC